MKLIKVDSYEKMSEEACEIIINRMNTLANPVLGLATGATPEHLYELLIEACNKNKVSFSSTTTFNLDEYVGLNGDHPNSYRYFMNERLFKHIDINKERIHIPDGKAEELIFECKKYDRLIEQSNGIDLQILGLGVNGHIGFNEPGTSFSKRTHIVDLDESTRNANSRFFEQEEEVPYQAITMGIKTILESKEIILLVSGENKAAPLKRLLNGEVSEEFPASILKTYPNVTVIADKAAYSLINEDSDQLVMKTY